MMLLHSFFFHFNGTFNLPVGRQDGLMVSRLLAKMSVFKTRDPFLEGSSNLTGP